MAVLWLYRSDQMTAMRVAVTLEHLWHRVPGGTGVASLELVNALMGLDDAPELLGVAGRHSVPPVPPWVPPSALALRHHRWLHGPWLYEAWLRAGWPRVESITGPVDVVHATTIIPPPCHAPMVVTLHDLAFLHDPQHFTPRGVSVFRRSLDIVRRRAALVLCSSQATFDDAVTAGFEPHRLRLVPLGVRGDVASDTARRRVRDHYDLPERFVLFVGTVEPRKNLTGLIAALSHLPEPPPLIVAGSPGWGGAEQAMNDAIATASQPVDVRFIGFAPAADLAALYAEAAVLCAPSLREGYGLTVLEAMVQGTPVVTSRGTATEETAGGAAALVNPRDSHDIARGLADVLHDPQLYIDRGFVRAAQATWQSTAQATLAAYREVAS